jgi:hypothetical protein
MPHGFRLVPIQAEVASGNRKIRCDSQLFAGTRSQQGAVVADAQAKAAGLVTSGTCGPPANLAEEEKFAFFVVGSAMGLFQVHLMRIGQAARISTG